jgi:hypothetical protein
VPIVDGHRVCQVIHHLQSQPGFPFSLSQYSPAHVAQHISSNGNNNNHREPPTERWWTEW